MADAELVLFMHPHRDKGPSFGPSDATPLEVNIL